MSEKPVIFISHSSKDTELARLIKQQIEICIDGVEAFASDIEPGENWFQKVMGKLKEAQAIIVLVTPNSVAFSHWVWFEMGYFWSQHDTSLELLDEREKICYPLQVPNVELPNPLHDLKIQSASLYSKRDLISFFRNIAKRFNGETFELDYDSIINIAKQLSPIISSSENNSNYDNSANYNQYANYTLADLKEVLYDIVKTEQTNGYPDSPLFTESLIHYNDFDKENHLPEGTSEELLIYVMQRLDYIPEYSSENAVRFTFVPQNKTQNYGGNPQDLDDIPF